MSQLRNYPSTRSLLKMGPFITLLSNIKGRPFYSPKSRVASPRYFSEYLGEGCTSLSRTFGEGITKALQCYVPSHSKM